MEKALKGDEGFGNVELMETNDRVNVDIDIGCFSNLEDDEVGKKKKIVGCPQPLFPSSPSPFSRMLWFGGEDVFTRKPTTGCGSETSSSTSSSTGNNNLSKFKGKEGRLGGGALGSRTGTISVRKKPRKEQQITTNPNGGGGTVKQHVRKEKLGERIIALQQLVSPFGKSDTASVLHEALGYIKFLHDQVQVLSSAYLKQRPFTHPPRVDGTSVVVDLKSKGLCVVPIACMPAHVVGSNGADLWSPAMGSYKENGNPKQ